MKTLLLLALMIPSVVLGVSIDLQSLGQRSGDDRSLTVDGYSLLHPFSLPHPFALDGTAGGESASPGFKGWWITVTRESGAAFDGISFSGQLSGLESGDKTSAILVQGQTMDGNYYSEIFQFSPRLSGPGVDVTMNLDEGFRNLSWLRFSGLHGAAGFSIHDVELTTGQNVPESGPGSILAALIFAGLACAHVGMKMNDAPPIFQRIRRPRYSRASLAPR